MSGYEIEIGSIKNFLSSQQTKFKVIVFLKYRLPIIKTGIVYEIPDSLVSFIIIVPFLLYSEFPFSSSTHKRLFNFLLLQDKEKEVEEDDENDDTVLDLIRVRVVTRSCGNTLVGSFRWLLLITSSCINW